MSDENPNIAPATTVAAGQQALNQPIIFSTKGRIGRLRFLAYISGLMVIFIITLVAVVSISIATGINTNFIGPPDNPTAFSVITGSIVGILFLVFEKRRFNDINQSGWWLLLNLIPFVNFLLMAYLIFSPGTKGTNNFGPAPAANPSGVKIMGSVALTLFIILGIATISGNFLFFFGTPDKDFDALNNGDYETALKEYKPRAELGDADAQNSLGSMYRSGKGVTQDFKVALKWYKLAAEQGHADAQNHLGNFYAFGVGVVTYDLKAAFKWYKLAAEQGHADAQDALGVMYGNGDGVIQDYTLALMWLNIAESQGNKNTTISRYFFKMKMTAAQIEKAQKLTSECVAKNYKDC